MRQNLSIYETDTQGCFAQNAHSSQSSLHQRAPHALSLPAVWLLAIACGSLLITGCSEQRYPLSSVSGIVTLEGKPLVDTRVLFDPLRQGDSIHAGPGSIGCTDESGRFALVTLDGDEGAVVGPHRVMITTFQQDEKGKVIRKEEVPMHYLRDRSLSFEVGASGNESANFDLVGRPGKR